MKSLLILFLVSGCLHAAGVFDMSEVELRKQAEKDPEAMTELAWRVYTGKITPFDHKFIFETFTKAAEAGSARAEVGIGLCHKEAVHVMPSIKNAVPHFQKAVEMGNPQGMVELGICWIYGDGTPVKDTAKGMELLKRAADMGHPNGKVQYAYFTLNGLGDESQREASLELIKDFADNKGHARAAFFMGQYYKGYEIMRGEKKPELAKKYFLMAANGGDKMAMYQMGLDEIAIAWKPGTGAAKQMEAKRKGVMWYRKAMALNHLEAKLKLSKVLSREKSLRLEGENWYAYLCEEADKGYRVAYKDLAFINYHAPGYAFRDLDWKLSAKCFEEIIKMTTTQEEDGSWSLSTDGHGALVYLMEIYFEGGLGQDRDIPKCMELAARYAHTNYRANSYAARILLHPEAPMGKTREHFIRGYACMIGARRSGHRISDDALFVLRSRHGLTREEVAKAEQLVSQGFPNGITPILP